jgi:hypothetical protein
MEIDSALVGLKERRLTQMQRPQRTVMLPSKMKSHWKPCRPPAVMYCRPPARGPPTIWEQLRAVSMMAYAKDSSESLKNSERCLYRAGNRPAHPPSPHHRPECCHWRGVVQAVQSQIKVKLGVGSSGCCSRSKCIVGEASKEYRSVPASHIPKRKRKA